MTSRWWRAYDEAVDDPKLILLTDKQFRAWFNLCCICSANGGTLPLIPIVAVKLRTTPAKAKSIVAELTALGLVDISDGVPPTMHNWNGRQYQSDVSTPRVQRFRKRQRNVSSTVSATPPETETETETETEKKTEANASVVALAAKRGSRLPEDWQPSIEDLKFAGDLGLRLFEIDNEAAKFRDYWHGKAGTGASKRDWSATWRNWCRNAIERKPNGRGPHGPGSSVMDASKRLIAAEEARIGNGTGPLLDLTPNSPATSDEAPRALPKR